MGANENYEKLKTFNPAYQILLYHTTWFIKLLNINLICFKG